MPERWQQELERYGRVEPPLGLGQLIQQHATEGPTSLPTKRVGRRLPAVVLALLVASTGLFLLIRAFEDTGRERAPLGEGRVVNGKIAFVSDGITIVNPDGTGVQKIRESDPRDFDTQPSWSPDGTRIAFLHSAGGRFELLMFDLTTGSVTTVAGREYDVNSPQWSPDGTKIAFVSGNELFLINSNGTGATRLTNGAFPRWSPDGTQIVFESRSGVSVINSDGSGETDLAPGAWPAWSPTGAEIVFIDTDLQLSSISPDGTGLTRLTDLPNDSIGPPVWSPDGSRITFEALQGGNYDIYGMNADGTNLENLTGEPGDENMPTWSPDGMMIAFIAGESVSENPGNTMTFDVYIMKADGSEESRLTTGAAPAYALSWQSAQMATAS